MYHSMYGLVYAKPQFDQYVVEKGAAASRFGPCNWCTWKTMKIAEKLYTSGFISYPRTETNIFPKELNLRPLVDAQAGDPRWGTFANRINQEFGGPNPRKGKKSDQAHPPIHPIKTASNLAG